VLTHILPGHALLWALGIGHCDISLRNLMRKPGSTMAVLNDFDLASRFNPGEATPTQPGFERIGTKPFMALELLNEPGRSGPLLRRYRHDLESFVWVLVWVCGCVQDNQELDPIPQPFSTWIDDAPDMKVVVQKIVYCFREPKTQWTADYMNIGPTAIRFLHQLSAKQHHIYCLEKDVGEHVEKSDISHLRDLIGIAESKGLTLPQGMLWINESGWNTLRRFKGST